MVQPPAIDHQSILKLVDDRLSAHRTDLIATLESKLTNLSQSIGSSTPQWKDQVDLALRDVAEWRDGVDRSLDQTRTWAANALSAAAASPQSARFAAALSVPSEPGMEIEPKEPAPFGIELGTSLSALLPSALMPSSRSREKSIQSSIEHRSDPTTRSRSSSPPSPFVAKLDRFEPVVPYYLDQPSSGSTSGQPSASLLASSSRLHSTLLGKRSREPEDIAPERAMGMTSSPSGMVRAASGSQSPTEDVHPIASTSTSVPRPALTLPPAKRSRPTAADDRPLSPSFFSFRNWNAPPSKLPASPVSAQPPPPSLLAPPTSAHPLLSPEHPNLHSPVTPEAARTLYGTELTALQDRFNDPDRRTSTASQNSNLWSRWGLRTSQSARPNPNLDPEADTPMPSQP